MIKSQASDGRVGEDREWLANVDVEDELRRRYRWFEYVEVEDQRFQRLDLSCQ